MTGQTNQASSYKPIADYGIIGDCHTAALVSRDGSIDWYCPTRFDAPAVFCRLLDASKGGFFSLSPAGAFSAKRRYAGDTNILETVFSAGGSRVRVTDFMPVHSRTDSKHGYDVGTSRRILRRVEGLDGEANIELCFRPTFDYARGDNEIEITQKNNVIAHQASHYVSLASPEAGLEFKASGQGQICGQFHLRPGESRWLVLTEADDPDRILELPGPTDCERQLARTRYYWEQWAVRCTYRGPYRTAVLRSSLILKLLTYEPTGAIIAAPTTSLPEDIGGIRNWDYRFAWVRDSALIIYALMNVGYHEEAADFFEWLQETHHNDPSPDLQVLYRINGERELPESVLDHLEGYKGSRPVRIGNAAGGQLQLDIYGEVLTAAYLYFASGIGNREKGQSDFTKRERLLAHDWVLLRSLVERAAARWREPDNSIWEVRGGLQPFLYSRLMCWAALDRGIRLAREFSLEAPLNKWADDENNIRTALLTEGFNQRAGAFTQAFGSPVLDASSLLIPRTGFLPGTDSRVESTIKAVISQLTKHGLVYRYVSQDGLPGNEGMFLTCTFWLVDALSLSGQIDAAHDVFDHASSYANDLGLFSEEIDGDSNTLLGNFPQGFTHMALINAAVNLAKTVKHGPEKNTETEAVRARKAGPAAAEGYVR